MSDYAQSPFAGVETTKVSSPSSAKRMLIGSSASMSVPALTMEEMASAVSMALRCQAT